MPYLLNACYLLAMLALAPWLLYKAMSTGKYRRGWRHKLFGQTFVRESDASCVWFHGVSVGEIHLLRPLVARFRERHPDWDCVISTTTDTGFDEARKRFPDVPVIYWPFDFAWAVHRALHNVNPSLVILAESELWPNFLTAARQRGVPVMVINGRMSPRSFANWQRVLGDRHQKSGGFKLLSLLRPLRPYLRRLLNHISLWGVQTKEYAECFRSIGVDADRIHVTGSVKYDGVESNRHNPRTEELRRLLRVEANDIIWIAGSTQAPEEKMMVDIYRTLRRQYPQLRLFIVPRQKDRFGEVAELLGRSHCAFVRRSSLTSPIVERSAVVLVDSMGELGALWGLTDIAFVGGSLDGKRGGQNMIEPAAYGAAVVFGPHVWNFRDTATRLCNAGAAIQVNDAQMLEAAIAELVANPSERERLGHEAKHFVGAQFGATERTLDLIDRYLFGMLPRAHGEAA